jgi:hypothetical protein
MVSNHFERREGSMMERYRLISVRKLAALDIVGAYQSYDLPENVWPAKYDFHLCSAGSVYPGNRSGSAPAATPSRMIDQGSVFL